MSSETSEKDQLILASFSDFVIDHDLIDRNDLDQFLDDTIGAYIINAIKQLFEEYESHKIWLDEPSARNLAEDFDIENFIEIIDAYLTGFSTLHSNEIISWLIKLKKKLDTEFKTKNVREIIEQSVKKELEKEPIFECVEESQLKMNSKIEALLEKDEHLRVLVDMFPEFEFKEINKIYKKCNKNYEKAIDELLMLENVIRTNDYELTEEEKQELKEKTVQRFGVVAVKLSDDGKTLEPTKPTFKWVISLIKVTR
jgi:hypothetical protein